MGDLGQRNSRNLSIRFEKNEKELTFLRAFDILKLVIGSSLHTLVCDIFSSVRETFPGICSKKRDFYCNDLIAVKSRFFLCKEGM